MTEIDVIVLSDARSPALRSLTEQTLATLATSENPAEIQFHPMVIESDPTAGAAGYVGAQTIVPEAPFGYNRYMNIGIRAGRAEFVCMCNNDLVFHPGWARELLRAFADDPALLSASPYCRHFHGRLWPAPETAVIPGYENGVHVAGWCLFVRRSLFQVIGPLDERFVFWYCDDDYRRTLEKHRIKHALVTTARVDHLGSRSLGAETSPRREQLTSRQALLYHYKWGHQSALLYFAKLVKYHLSRLLARRAGPPPSS